MAQRILASLLLLLFISISCNRTESINTKQSTPPSTLLQNVTPNTIITLARGGCLGTCPVYTLRVSADGEVIFEGNDFVKRKGIVKSKITQEQVKQLISEFDKANYFSLKDSYTTAADGCPVYWSDESSAATSISIDGNSKSILHYYGCREKDTKKGTGEVFPRELTELERRIDEIVGTKQWIE